MGREKGGRRVVVVWDMVRWGGRVFGVGGGGVREGVEVYLDGMLAIGYIDGGERCQVIPGW